MGRYAGWIALHSGVSGSADVILIPEIPYRFKESGSKIKRTRNLQVEISQSSWLQRGLNRSWRSIHRIPGNWPGGNDWAEFGEKVAAELLELTGKKPGWLYWVIFYAAGTPCSMDRLTGLRFGAAAVLPWMKVRTALWFALGSTGC